MKDRCRFVVVTLFAAVGLTAFVPGAMAQVTPGFQERSQRYEVVDLDGRPWVVENTIGIRLNEQAAEELNLPDPMVVNDVIQFPREDPKFQTRFSTRRNRGRAEANIIVAVPDRPAETLPYELQFFAQDGKAIYRPIPFNPGQEGFGLGKVLTVQARRQLPPTDWLLAAGGMLLFVGLVTFGVYRPFYAWRLARGASVEKSRDWAFFWWWFLTLSGYALLLWMFLPRSLPFWILCGILGLVLLIRLIMCLRPTARMEEAEAV